MNILIEENQHYSLGLIFKCFHLILDDILFSPLLDDKDGQLPESGFKRAINRCSISYWILILEYNFLLLIYNSLDYRPRKCEP